MDYRKSSLTIGRRTRTNVLKDKDIRKDIDGCDIFEDYWTDSGDDQSSSHSQSSYSAVSTKSVKDVSQSKSANDDSGSKLRETKTTPMYRFSETDHDKSGSTVDAIPAEIPTAKSQRRSQMQKSLNSDLSASRPSLSKNFTLIHDELDTNRMQRESYSNDTENEPDKASRDETAVLHNSTSPRHKQSNVFTDASEVEEFSDSAVSPTSGTVNISRRILKSPKRISKKHIFDLMNKKNLGDTEFGVLKTVSPLSKIVNKTMTLSDKNNLKSSFQYTREELNDPRNSTKMNKSAKAKLFSATSPNSTTKKKFNVRKSVKKHGVKTRSAMEMEKILSNYDEYDARIMQIIRENDEDNQKCYEKNALATRTPGRENDSLNDTTSNDALVLEETANKDNSSNDANQTRILKNCMLSDSSDRITRNKMPPHAPQGKNNTMVLNKVSRNLSTLKSFENTEESDSENDIFGDIPSKADKEQRYNNINVSEKVLVNPVLVSKPQSDHKSKQRKKYKNTVEDESKQIEKNSEDVAVKLSSKSRKRKKSKISHTKQKNTKNISPLKEVFDNEHDANYLSLKKNKSLKSFERSKKIEESSVGCAIENISIFGKRNVKEMVSKYVSENGTLSKEKSGIAEVVENYESDINDQSQLIALKDSESGISHQNSVNLSSVNKNTSSKFLERSKQIDEESSSEDNTSENVLMSRNRKLQKFSKNKNISQNVHENITVAKTKITEDRNAIIEMQKNNSTDPNDQSEYLDSEPDVSAHKSVTLSDLKKNKSKKSLERSEQAYEGSSEVDTSVIVPMSRNRKMQKVSENKNIPPKVHENLTVNKTKSTRDRSAIKELQGNYNTNTNYQSEHLATEDSAPGASHNPVNLKKNKSLKSLERSKRIGEISEDNDIENIPMLRNSNKRLKVTKNRSNCEMLLESTVTNKTKINVGTNVDKEVSEMEIDVGHQSELPILNNICPEQDVSLHQTVHPLPSRRKRAKPKKKHSLAMSKNITTETNCENQVRKSNRQRYAPLAHWRNERLVYRYERGLVKVLGVTEGTKEDNLPIQYLKRYYNRDKIQNKHKKIKKATIYDSINDRKVKISLVNTYPSVPWYLPPNATGTSHYRIKRVLESTNCAFGFVEIDIHSSKPSQYMPEEDLQMTLIKGQVEVVVQKNSFRVSANDMFVVPRNTAYILKNVGQTKALLTYAVGRFKFLENQLSK